MPTKTKSKKGLSVKTFRGLNKKRMEKRSFGGGLRLQLKQGDTVPVQMVVTPDEFTEFEQHSFQDSGRWYYVPCAGEDCPLCADEDQKRSKKGYRFAAPVYNLKERKMQVLEGPKDLAGRIFYRYERAPSKFLKRTYDVTKFPTQPVSYDFQVGEDDLVKITNLASKMPDIDKYLEGELRAFYGDEMPSRSALDDDEAVTDADDDDEDEEDDTYTLADLKKMAKTKAGRIKLAEIAETLDIDTDDLSASDLIDAIVEAQDEEPDDDDDDEEDDEDDEDDEDEDTDDDEDDDEEDEEEDDDEDEDEEDDEDEDDEPAPRKTAKKAAKKATKATKKAASRKTPRRR